MCCFLALCKVTCVLNVSLFFLSVVIINRDNQMMVDDVMFRKDKFVHEGIFLD